MKIIQSLICLYCGQARLTKSDYLNKTHHILIGLTPFLLGFHTEVAKPNECQDAAPLVCSAPFFGLLNECQDAAPLVCYNKNMKPDYLHQVEKIILSRVKNLPVKVYFFGSRATGHNRATSDIDIAILPEGKIPANLFTELRYYFEESNIPYKIDLVDLSTTDKAFYQNVIKTGIQWKG